MSRRRGAGGLVVLFLLTALATLVSPPSAGTVVPGQDLIGDTTWTLAGSPYYVVGDVNVSAGASLAIEPGVQVLFEGYHTLAVFGNLTAVGTPSAPIRFASNASVPFTGDWRGIRVQPGANATISHVLITYALWALWMLDASGGVYHNLSVERSSTGLYLAQATNLTIRDSSFSNNSIGVRIQETTNSSLEGIRAWRNGEGIVLSLSSRNNSILRSSIYLNSVVGIDIRESFNNRIWGNEIYSNGVEALDDGDTNVWDGGYPAGGNLWGSYSGNDTYNGPLQNLIGPDSIGDTPHWIDNNSMDRYPRFTPGPNLPPLIDLLAPGNNTLFRPGTGVWLRLRDQDLSGGEYAVDGGSPVPFAETTIVDTTSWSDGAHTVSVAAWDVAGNRSSKRFDFRVDAILPEVALVSPPEGSTFRPGGVPIDLEVSDANLARVVAYLDGELLFLLSSPFDVPTIGWTDGNHTLAINATDTPGNYRNISFSFRTDGTPPQVLASTPVSGSTGIPTDTAIQIDFSEAMNRGSVAVALSFPVPYTRVWSRNDTRLSLVPDRPLAPGTSYLLEVDVRATDVAGNSMASRFSATFSTVPAPPGPGEPDPTLLVWALVGILAAVAFGVAAYLWHRERARRRRRQLRRKRKAAAARAALEAKPTEAAPPPGPPGDDAG